MPVGVHVKVLQKGKITIPSEIRDRLAIREGDTLTLEVSGGQLILLPPKTVQNPTELLIGLAEGVVVEEPVKDELRRAAAKRLATKLSRVPG
jgi:AbrB family looped-hinge helix DNA binding protein